MVRRGDSLTRSRRQLVEQRLRLFQIERVEAFGEPAVNRSKEFARFPQLALVAPEARETHCGQWGGRCSMTISVSDPLGEKSRRPDGYSGHP